MYNSGAYFISYRIEIISCLIKYKDYGNKTYTIRDCGHLF